MVREELWFFFGIQVTGRILRGSDEVGGIP